jgi:hypothetical protein
MTRRISKSATDIRRLIAKALKESDAPPPDAICEANPQEIDLTDAQRVENEEKEQRIADLDAQLTEIARRHASGKVGLRQYRRDGLSALGLLTQRFDATHGIWLFSAHAITRSLEDMIAFGVVNSPLLEPDEMLYDDGTKLWPLHGRWEVRWASVAAVLFLQAYCGHSATKAAGLIAGKLRDADFRSERGSSDIPQAATIARWVREDLKSDRERGTSQQHGIVDLFAFIGVPEEELPLMGEASVLKAFVEIVEFSVVYQPPRRS